jgi:hypothetical protein
MAANHPTKLPRKARTSEPPRPAGPPDIAQLPGAAPPRPSSP